MKAQMKQANKAMAHYAVILGDDEIAKNVAVLRDMESSAQTEVPMEEIIKKLTDEVKG